MEPTPHVLVVDDHRDIREPLARYLEKHGLRASLAEDSASARRLLKSAAVDLVVLDVMMPGEDGLQLCRHLRGTTDIPAFGTGILRAGLALGLVVRAAPGLSAFPARSNFATQRAGRILSARGG